MASQNPFSGDDVLGEAWEQGYLAGFAEPEVDHFRPFAPDILEAYQQGEQAGRDDRRQLPPDAGGVDAETGESPAVEFLIALGEEVGLHAYGHTFFEMMFKNVGGLIFLVLSVLNIPDTPLHPLEEDWTGPADQPGETYVAVCPREDHPLVQQGATNEGYWAGQGRQFFGDAFRDVQAHGHAEGFVARCNVPDGTCGPVWVGSGQ